jgi:hypothetical protein
MSFIASSSVSFDPTPALNAWEKCVELQSYGLFTKAEEGPNYNYVDITLINNTAASNNYRLYEINKDANVTCKVGDTTINPSRKSPVSISEGRYTFRCIKPAGLPTTLSLNTSAGSAISIGANGTELSQAELRQLQTDTNALKQQVGQQLNGLQASVAALTARLDGLKVTLVDRKGDRTFLQNEFWGPAVTYPVKYTCPEKSVMVGIDWVFQTGGDGTARSPSEIKYICRELAS